MYYCRAEFDNTAETFEEGCNGLVIPDKSVYDSDPLLELNRKVQM